MCKSSNLPKSLTAVWSAACAGLFALSLAQGALAEPYQEPLFLVAKVKPITVLNMSRDHQLYFKLYDDFSDITDSNLTVAGGGANSNYGKEPDGLPDTSYVHGFDYYGYFDSYKCYVYSTASNQFNPVSFTATKYCNAAGVTNQWSGNFLNWASMTRIDAIRKILYGGMRSTDTTAATVLERAYLPTDAHSFAKYYAGADTPQLTPFSANINADPLTTGITICNTSTPGTATFSQAATSAVGARPLLRVARGNYSLWASNERYQCRWEATITDNASYGLNGNNAALSLINAYNDSPINGHKLGTGSAAGEYVARVAVCVDGLTAMDVDHDNEKCKTYTDGTAKKPLGVLQQNAGTQNFALLTGSYSKNKSGGVLRKAASVINDEINANGIFQVPASGNSIIKTLDLLRIYGYGYADGLYHNNSHSILTPGPSQRDGCLWGRSSFSDGQCVNWGNPQAEIYLESLRYLSGETSPNYDAVDSAYIPGLNRVSTWADPINTAASGNYCAPLSVVQFDASMTSYDADSLTGAPSTIGSINTATNTIGAAEGIHGGSYFVGENGANNNQLCTPKSITALANVRGSCPDAPRLAGSYQIAGLAYKARSAGVGAGREKVTTYGVSLAPSVPNVVVPVPGSDRKVTILPACRNNEPTPDGNCAIVDFKITSQTYSADSNSGRLYVNWEDSEQGGDYDQDMWGIIEYTVTATDVVVRTDVIAQSTPNLMVFGYVISGTTADDFYAHSGINGITAYNCTNCTVGNAASSRTYTVGSSASELLEPPLYYAAKWGGYKSDEELTDAEIAELTADEFPYYRAIDPRKLEENLAEILGAIGRTGSSATVASNSTRLEDETYLYQALFNSEDWSGSLKAFELRSNGTVSETAVWDTSETLIAGVARRIYTRNDSGSTVEIDGSWPSVPATMKAALQLSGELNDVNAQKRFNWLMGIDHQDLRVRTNIMGDIVNSDPAYAGASNQRYDQLPVGYGAGSYEAYVTNKANKYKVVFVGANDGMLHAFRADGPEEELGTELFAYIPRGVYSKLADLSSVNYQHKYTVDGPLYVGDAYIDSDDDGDKEWRTLVGGTLGAGGRGAFLLDVTDTLVAGSTAAPRVVFDLSADDASLPYRNDLGYSTGKMLIVPTANNTWSAIFSNGAESVNGTAKLIAVDVDNPSIYKVIDTAAVTGNGLSGVALLPDGNGVSTYAYAGDLKGNMWKFNLTDSVRDNWRVAFPVLGGGTAEPLIKVIDSDGNTQSITATPTLGLNGLKTVEVNGSPVPSVMVYFGTGKYASTADISDSAVQSIYAIADINEPITLTAAARDTELKKKEITSETGGVRVITPDKTPLGTVDYAVDWDTYKGWFLDLKYQNALGERVIAKPLLISDRLILNTFVPSPNQCDYGGGGWLMELTGVGDKFIGLTVLVNNANHQLMDPIIGDLIPIISGEKVFVVGSALGTVEEGSVLESFEGEMGAGTRGRMSWRQLK